jgi:hypothetical protein
MATAARERLARTLRGDTQAAFSIELTGRPYTLVLNKTEALFAREQEARIRDDTDLEWLAAQSGSGRRTTAPSPGSTPASPSTSSSSSSGPGAGR